MSSSSQVLPFDDNICLREPCENYMKCVSVLKFDSSPPFIASNTVLFRPIHPINGLRCRCPIGFTGDYCETEIDLCYSGPCKNNGRCRRREGGYTCECQEDFTGESDNLSPYFVKIFHHKSMFFFINKTAKPHRLGWKCSCRVLKLLNIRDCSGGHSSLIS